MASCQLRDSASLLPVAQRLLGAAAAVNLKSTPSSPFHLTVEFVDGSGQLVTTAPHDVPSLSPRQSHAFELQVSGKRIAGWRYRAS